MISTRANAFTLIELMISIALVLLLIAGINQVFSITASTVSINQATSAINRDLRAAYPVLAKDFKQIVNIGDVPLVIRNERVAAFRDRAEMLADRDYSPSSTPSTTDTAILTVDLDNNNVEGESGVAGEITPRSLYGFRNYRIDQIRFFAQGSYPRQTGNDGVFADTLTSSEACIWIGHIKRNGPSLAMADDRLLSYQPVAPATIANADTNPFNFFAKDWVLGRVAMLLIQPDVSGAILSAAVPQQYFGRDPGAPATTISPLAQGSHPTSDGTSFDTAMNIQWSRYDLAGTTIPGYTTIIGNAITAGNATWATGGDFLYRFQGHPFVLKPMSSEVMARTSPCLLPSCIGFVVEFAGDFVEQDATGMVTNSCVSAMPATDNIVDFVIPATGSTAGMRQIRWYGFPRDLNGDRSIPGRVTSSTLNNNELPDVVPLRDIIRTAPGMSDFLKDAPNTPPNWVELEVPTQASEYASTSSPMAWNAYYTTSWGPDTASANRPRPSMIRITITLGDSQNRIPEGQTVEYIFNLQ
ncbi:MAG: PilW family protein [Tepidisphaeraceae bacterium]